MNLWIAQGSAQQSLLPLSPLSPSTSENILDDLDKGVFGEVEAPKVLVDSWIESHEAGGTVVVSLLPKNGALLVRDPGTTFEVAANNAVDWDVTMPAEMRDPAGGYWTTQQFFRMPFSGPAPSLVEGTLTFAYCIKDYQCIFGTEELTILK